MVSGLPLAKQKRQAFGAGPQSPVERKAPQVRCTPAFGAQWSASDDGSLEHPDMFMHMFYHFLDLVL